MNSAIASLQAQFNATFTAVQAWVLYQIGLAKDELKGGVSSAFDTLKNQNVAFADDIAALETTLVNLTTTLFSIPN